jgi:hypothetical protein
MDQDLAAAVEDFRRRIAAQNEVVQRFEGLVRNLESQESPSNQATKSLANARADLAQAQSARRALKAEYARFRLREALGQDPTCVEEELFDQELSAMTSGPPCRRDTPDPRGGRIGFDALRSLLLADLPPHQLIENARGERRSDAIIDMLQERTGTKTILRQWAAMLQSDPYVADMLRRAAEEAGRFTQCLNDFLRGLDDLRVNYEISQRNKVDSLAVAFDGRKLAIQAVNYWERVERLFPQETRKLGDHFLGLEQARERLRIARDALNAELRRFMVAFVPRYVAYLTSQSPERQRRLGRSRLRARRFCQYLLDEVERTDFLLRHGGGIEMAVPRIPENIVAFRKLESFQRYKKAVQKTALAEASTVAEGSR